MNSEVGLKDRTKKEKYCRIFREYKRKASQKIEFKSLNYEIQHTGGIPLPDKQIRGKGGNQQAVFLISFFYIIGIIRTGSLKLNNIWISVKKMVQQTPDSFKQK